MGIFADATGFEWDAGNKDKNLIRHGVSNSECEETFADEAKIIRDDEEHSLAEMRHHLIGETNHGRLLFISFTVRGSTVRVISARDVNKKERTYYEKR